MDLTVDKTKNDVKYIDKDNLCVVRSKEIIKINNGNNVSNIDTYVNIISGYYNLNNVERVIVKYVIENDNAYYDDIVYLVNDVLNKSARTVSRTINNLIEKRVIVYNGVGGLNLVSGLYVRSEDIAAAKLLVINLNDNKPNINLL